MANSAGDAAASLRAPRAIASPMSRAARCPSAMASMRLRGPKARSPPHQMRGCAVRSVARSVGTPPHGAALRPSVAGSQLASARWPMAKITVSQASASSGPSSITGAKRPASSNTRATGTSVTPATRPSAPSMRRTLRRSRRWIRSPAVARSSSGSTRSSSRASSATMCTSRAPRRWAVRAASIAA
jgi:hypothetical protein